MVNTGWFITNNKLLTKNKLINLLTNNLRDLKVQILERSLFDVW